MALVVPVNMFVPDAIAPLTETSFQGSAEEDPGGVYCIPENAPVILPEAKFTENVAFPVMLTY